MDLVKNLLKSYYLYTLLSDVRCSTDVQSFLIARTSGHFRKSDTSTTETILRMSRTLRRPTLSHQKHSYGCPALLGRPYLVHWIVGHTFHSGRSSDDCRTSGPIWASGHPTFSRRPAILYPKRSLFLTTYIYSLPFHGIGLTIHLEPHRNTPHSLSLSFIHTKS